MIEKIYDIAKVYVKDLPFEKKLSQNLGRDKYLIVINLDEKKFEDLVFSEVGVNDEKIFFYQKKGNFSVSFSPSIYLQGDDKKDKNALKKLIEFFNHEKTKDIYEVLLSSFDAIYEKLTQIDKRERQNLAIVIVVKINGEIIYPADHEGIAEVFRSRLTESLKSSKKDAHSRCFLCGREVDSYPILNEVFKFSSFDKPGFTPVMSRNSAGISNICMDCFADLKAARNFINENLTFSFFGGGKLWIIPSGDSLGIKKVVNNITNIFSKKGRTTFANIERELEEILSDEISIHYDFVILRISNNEEKILLHIEDVSPSRISQIHTTSKKIVT
ncbi:MAG: hypothetical protein J7L34_06770 [Thermotogaceae bacterium]|nr:hypothetical protein [Thermotogaceae bacterium]